MDWVDKLNRRVLRGLRKHDVQKVEADSRGSTLIESHQRRFIPWSEVQEILVVKQPPLADGSFALVIREADSTITIVDDTATGYADFCAELPRRLPGVIPYEKWVTELTATEHKDGEVIFRRPV